MKRFVYVIFYLVFVLLIISCSSKKTNKKIQIQFIPRENWESEITFIDDLDYYTNLELVKKIEKARKVSSIGIGFIPKNTSDEGNYELFIYENDICIDNYRILNENYIFDNNNSIYLKAPGILNSIRREFYLRLIQKEDN